MVPPRYSKLTPALLDSLRSIVGLPHVLTDRESLKQNATDATGVIFRMPEAVVRPGSAGEVAGVLRLCDEHRVPVTPRGGGTGLSGGAMPVQGGIVLVLDRMNRILEIDRESMAAVVEAGVTTQAIQEAVEAVGLFYPPDLPTSGSSTLGGNIAHNAGGTRAVKYGVTRDWVLGCEAVLPTGEVIHLGGKLVKSSTGYNLTQLLVGSEGTLAVVTRLVLRLRPFPAHSWTLVAPFADMHAAARLGPELFRMGVVPRTLELMERRAIQAVEEKTGESHAFGSGGAIALVEVDGTDPGAVEAEAQKVGEACARLASGDVMVCDTPAKVQRVWKLRDSFGEILRPRVSRAPDIVVPRSQVPEFFRALDEVKGKYPAIETISFGHAGDGNIHLMVLKGSTAEWRDTVNRAIEEVYRRVVALGGTISAEHGVGAVNREFLKLAFTEAEVDLMRRIKMAFDPHGILNPGKIFSPGG
ncbi:MAG: FAD-binding oxidoreductase [Euryarchaeota archaeon]|nr:FAD-binding oxidoreductase [Euryarchaeota archaeon]